jgi:hypothetical protein
MSDSIAVNIRVRDEAQLPVPHVTVWSATEYEAHHLKDFGPYQSLRTEDLWRAAQRYGGLHDIITEYGDKPLTMLKVRHMCDAGGGFADVVDYQNETGKGNRYRRPDPLCFGFVFMKHGYLPGKAQFLLPKGQNEVDAVVTLKRDRNRPLESPAYARAYDEIRYQLSYTGKNAAMTMANHNRLEELRCRLEETALEAIAAGDRPTAARMFIRMSFMPQLIFQDGRIHGFSQARPRPELVERSLQMAYQLDPSNLYLIMRRYNRDANFLDKRGKEERIRARLELVQAMIDAYGEKIWPVYYEIRAVSYAELGEYATAYRLYMEAAEMEPKFADWKGEVADMKKRMKKGEVGVPDGW